MTKIALFALNGIGSLVFETLHGLGHDVVGVWTRKEPAPYPYFDVPDIEDLVRTAQIPIYFEHEPLAPECRPDLLLSATYHKKIAPEQIKRANQAVNLHFSLLPRHAGRNPFAAAVEAGDRVSGVTAHQLTQEWDAGDHIAQWKCAIDGLSENEVRKRLGLMAACMAAYIANLTST